MTRRIPATLVVATAVLAAAAAAAPAAPSAPPAVDPKTGLPPGYRLPIPSHREHAEFVVETNKKGQVVKVDSGKRSGDSHFNAFVYGNALQAFIRTPDGHAVPGLYRLTYDFDPKTLIVKRGVDIVRAGGVDPNAQGAVDQMADIARRQSARAQATAAAQQTPLPDFRDITGHK